MYLAGQHKKCGARRIHHRCLGSANQFWVGVQYFLGAHIHNNWSGSNMPGNDVGFVGFIEVG